MSVCACVCACVHVCVHACMCVHIHTGAYSPLVFNASPLVWLCPMLKYFMVITSLPYLSTNAHTGTNGDVVSSLHLMQTLMSAIAMYSINQDYVFHNCQTRENCLHVFLAYKSAFVKYILYNLIHESCVGSI